MQKPYSLLIYILLQTAFLNTCESDTDKLKPHMRDHLALTAALMSKEWPTDFNDEKFHLNALHFLSTRIIHTKAACLQKSSAHFSLIPHELLLQFTESSRAKIVEKSFALFVSNRPYSTEQVNKTIKEASENSSLRRIFRLEAMGDNTRSHVVEISSVGGYYPTIYIPNYLNYRRIGTKTLSRAISNMQYHHHSKLPTTIKISECNLFITSQYNPRRNNSATVTFWAVPESKKER